MVKSTEYKRGFRNCLDEVLNLLQTIEDEHYVDAKTLQHRVFKVVSEVETPD